VKILVLAATEIEVRSLMENLRLIKVYNDQFTSCAFESITIDVLMSGIGMVAKAYQLGKYLQKDKYDLALNIGIAGSFRKEIALGSVVNVVQDQFSEMGAEDGDRFTDIAGMNFKEFDTYPYAKGILKNDTNFNQFGIGGLKQVCGITSNTIHGKQESISEIIKRFNPDIETMGGAAFLYACLCEKIPCAQIRSVSNYVEVRDRSKWEVHLAIDQLTLEVLRIFSYLNKQGNPSNENE